MSALSIQPTYPIFTDIDGQPLEDGYIWIGVANLAPIVNPITVYWDAALTIPAAQPIRTRGGYPVNSGTPARLYVNSNYSIQVQNKNGSVVYSAPTATERYSGVVVLVDATDVTFTQNVPSPATRDVAEKLYESLSVLDFPGVDPTGVSDSTAGIQAAINAALSTANGTLLLPKGTYAVTSLNIYPTGGKSLVLVGDGAYNSTFIKFGGGTSPLLNISGTAGGGGGNGVVSKCQFKNFGVQGTAKAFTGIYADTLAHFFMEGVYIVACDIGLRSLGSLIFAARSCFFIGNDIGFQADQSPVNNGYSNLIKFDDCVFQSNALYHGLLNRGQQIVFANCDCESGAVGFRVSSTYEDETLLSSVTWNNCWWEGNSSNPVIVDSSNTWVTMRDCTLYGPASAVTINGSGNRVNLQNCYGTEYLNMADSTGTIKIDNCLFPVYSISTQNHVINNLLGSGGANPQLPSVARKMIVTNGASPNTADTNSGAPSQVLGNSQATNGFLSKKQITVTTSNVPLVTASLLNVLVFVHGYNTSGGAQGWWLLAGTTVISSNDTTGTTPIFSFVGSTLNMRTTTGTLELNVSALL